MTPQLEPLDEPMVIASHVFTAKYFLSEGGRWGHQREDVWDGFLDWLSISGLLTTKVQSRGSPDVASASLDGLRQGNVGKAVPRESIKSTLLFTNEFLP